MAEFEPYLAEVIDAHASSDKLKLGDIITIVNEYNQINVSLVDIILPNGELDCLWYKRRFKKIKVNNKLIKRVGSL